MAGTRSALIIATYAYDDAAGLTTLRAPRRDAEELSEVLGDPRIGGFEVRTVVNQPAHVVNLEVARFFADRRPDDLLLLHFSCHGVKDDSGELYFAATDTRLDLLEASAVSAAFVNKVMDRSRSSRVVLLLDCCYAGAFARGMSSRGGPGLDLQERLAGRGRAVITASTALQFSFEDGDLADGDTEERPSVFTRSLVDGLRSGEADRDLDGVVSLDELYGYVYDAVTATTPNQTPGKWAFGLEGDLHIARRVTPVTVPSELPEEIKESVESRVPWHRESVIPELERLMHGAHPGRALGARLALERLCDDDSRQVATHALTVLAAFPQQRTAPLESTAAPPAADPVTDFLPVPAREEPLPTESPEPAEPVEAAEPAEAAPPLVTPHVTLHVTPPVTGPVTPTADPPPSARRRPLWWPAAALLVVVALAAAAWWALGSDGQQAGRATATDAPRLPKDVLLVARPGDGVIHLVQVDTRSGTQVAGAPSPPGRLPTLSPRRDAVAYVAGAQALALPAQNLGWQPYVARADFSHPRALLPPASRTARCSYAGRAAWAPDRDDLLVLPCRDAVGAVTGLQRVTASGRLVGREKLVSGMAGDPTWTGDGRIVFARVVGPQTRLFALPTDLTGAPKPLFAPPNGSLSDFSPDWSAHGLLFLRAPNVAHRGDVEPGTVMVAAGGRHPGPVQGIASKVYMATWSGDGTKIAYLLPTTTKGRLVLGVFDLRTKASVTTSVSGQIGAPAWGSR